jgi:hypothetical protein
MNSNPSLIFTILLFTSLVFLTSHFLTSYFYKKKVLFIFKTLFSVEPTFEVDKVLP